MTKENDLKVFTKYRVDMAPRSFLSWCLVALTKLKLDRFYINENSKDQTYFESVNGGGTRLVEDFINRYR